MTTDRVLPDIVIHRRGNDKHNLLIIEVKKATNPDLSNCDKKKLELFTQKFSEGGDYQYSFGLFIKFNLLKDPKFNWYNRGTEILNTEKDSTQV